MLYDCVKRSKGSVPDRMTACSRRVSSVGDFVAILPNGRFAMPPETNMGRMFGGRVTRFMTMISQPHPGYLKRLPAPVARGGDIGR